MRAVSCPDAVTPVTWNDKPVPGSASDARIGAIAPTCGAKLASCKTLARPSAALVKAQGPADSSRTGS